MTTCWFAVTISLFALAFDFLNGFHDAANSIATVVSTRVLSPRVAVIWAAFFNFIAAFTFGTAVAKTIGKGMVDLRYVNLYVILAGLLGAIFWNILTWYFGLPVSSSHALIGGYAGATVAKAGWGVIIVSGWTKTLLFILLSPAIGFVLGAGKISPARLRGNCWNGKAGKWTNVQSCPMMRNKCVGGLKDGQTQKTVTPSLLPAGPASDRAMSHRR